MYKAARVAVYILVGLLTGIGAQAVLLSIEKGEWFVTAMSRVCQ